MTLDLANKKTNCFSGILNVAIVGIVSEQKNQLDALVALKILRAKGINNVKIHIIGSNKEDYLKQIKIYIDEYGLQNYVILYGHQFNVQETLKNMNIGLVCAHDEAFGRVTIEYMLHRMPVIASKSGANEELVHDGQNGLLYELYNSEELAEKIAFFIKNPLKLETMGVLAQEFAKKNFSSEPKFLCNL